MWMLQFVTAFLVSCIGSSQGAKFLLTVPKKPHFDTQYTATISAFEIYQKESISLEYRGIRDSSRIINSTVLHFEFDGVQTWSVTFPWKMMESLQESALTLTMETLFSKPVKKTLYFSKSTGYIFIQTDKPLYTPRQKVKFRIIAVDEYQRLAEYPLKVDIRNEKLIIVDRMRYSAADAFKGQEFELPKETPPGNWTISANFEAVHNVQSAAQTVKFEVREYVLPRFSASIDIDKDVITKNTNWITVKVKAKYVYGENVMGSVEMQLGIWDPTTGVQMLPERYTSNLTNGEYREDVRVSKLIPKEMIVRKNRRLLVNVNVTEEGTLENDTITDTSTFIAHPYYEITYEPSKTHFKPGFPYTLHTQVRAQSGRPAEWLDLWVASDFRDKNGKRVGGCKAYGCQYSLDKEGKSRIDFDIPETAHRIMFKTTVLDFKAGQNNDNEWNVPVLRSLNGQYIHVSLVKPIVKNANGLVKLSYTPAVSYAGYGAPVHRITVLVLARGHTVYSTSVVRTTDGRSTVQIPHSLYSEISPSMRIVASFYHKGGKGYEFVIDSLQVDTDHVCVEELSLHRPGGIFASPMPKKPKEKYKLQVRGKPGMHVGLVAVDKSVFLLNDAHTLTRESMFAQLGSHDQGTGGGDGNNIDDVLTNSGLLHMFLDSENEEDKNPFTQHLLSKTDVPFLQGVKRGIGSSIFLQDLSGKGRSGAKRISEAPPQTVRKYFPESWLFEEHTLPKTGRNKGIMDMDLTLPDSITTWSFLAVGLSSFRGVCVSSRLEQKVQKNFFVDVRMPYKVTRLEEVKVKIAIYNYLTQPRNISVTVSGDSGLCFSSNSMRGSTQNSTSFQLKIGNRRTKSQDIKVIPLVNGDLTIRVDASSGISGERDVVERQLNVVAEGLRQRKSLTFVLDPGAKHAFNPQKRRKIMLADTATIKNTIDLRRRQQKTKINMAMPKEVIRGTENCKISAFGDLMGDIINHAVIKSKSLMEGAVPNIEEVLGDLGPTVHALLYANQSGIMDKALSKRARASVTHGVARLLKYRKGFAFAMTPESPEGTWLTAVVLKTLCRASSLAFIDKAMLIDHGFYWLLKQKMKNETLKEKDWRLAKDSWDYQVMLSAEVLISILECERTDDDENHGQLIYDTAFFLEENLEKVNEPMVLAKMAYALTLFDQESEFTTTAVKKLASISKKNLQGQVYWSSEVVTNEKKKVPFWYRQGVKASAIEATAFALLVFLKHGGSNVDAIADWLVSQRNDHGTFVSALDSMAAIQALSEYSVQKTGLKVDLSCNVKSDQARQYSRSFKFTEKNAIRPESLNDVPVGHSLEVLTKGQGLGQMQVNVEYNIPIDPNEKCPFNVTIEIKSTEVNFYPDMISDPMCTSCSWGCRLKEVNKTDLNDTAGNSTALNGTEANTTTTEETPRLGKLLLAPPPPPNRPVLTRNPNVRNPRPRVRPPRPASKTRAGNRYRLTGRKIASRKPRSVRTHSSASRKSVCMRVCLRHVETGSAGHTRLEVDMLTGYLPVTTDVQRLKSQDDVVDAYFQSERETLIVIFKEVSDEEQTCISFRAVDQQEVGRPTPATVLVTEVGNPAPSCALEYHAPSNQESLQVYCADFSNSNRGECRCYSGICSQCAPMTQSDKIGYTETKDLICRSDIAYQVQISKMQDRNQWVEIDATVLSVNKTGKHRLNPQDTIRMMSPSSCNCPVFFDKGDEKLYMVSADVEKMVDRYGNIIHHYLLDEQSYFLRVDDPPAATTTTKSPRRSRSRPVPPTVQHAFLKQAFRLCQP